MGLPKSPLACLAPLVVLALGASVAFGIDRYPLRNGDSYTAEALLAGEFDEYVVRLARGSKLTVGFGRAAPGRLRPGVEFVDENYRRRGVEPLGPTRLRSQEIQDSGTYRFLIGGIRGTVGGYRLSGRIQPGRKFVLKAKSKDPNPPTQLRFGAYEGFTADLTIKWKGDTELGVTLTGPDGTSVDLPEPTRKKRALIYRDVPTPSFGDYVLGLDVPEDAKKWNAKVKVAGSLERGEDQDVRVGHQPRSLELVTRGFLLNPFVVVRGELGGPNDIGLVGSINGPEPQVKESSVSCARSFVDGARPATHYRLVCSDGVVVDVTGLDEDGDGRAVSYDAHVRSPAGRGTSQLRDITYDDDGLPAAWTEIRTFATTGRRHELHFSDVDRFSNGVIRAYTVEHVRPDGTRATYQYAPINLPNQ